MQISTHAEVTTSDSARGKVGKSQFAMDANVIDKINNLLNSNGMNIPPATQRR
jgi:hypothetical protein